MAEPTITTEVPYDEPNGETNGEIRGPLTSAQRVTASSPYNEVAPDPYGREATHFTEIRVLKRDVSCAIINCALLNFLLDHINSQCNFYS